MEKSLNASGDPKAMNGVQKRIANKLKVAARTNSNRMHIISRENKWVIKREGAKKATKIYDSKQEAVKAAKVLLKEGIIRAIVIHNKDGSIAKSA